MARCYRCKKKFKDSELLPNLVRRQRGWGIYKPTCKWCKNIDDVLRSKKIKIRRQ